MTTVASDEQKPPATAIDYALINVGYVGALVGIGTVVHRRGSEVEFSARDLVLLALATFSLAEVLAHERIATWLREPFNVETTDHRPLRPRGRGMRYAIGELLACSRCLGSWSALGLVGLRVASPPAAGAVTPVLAAAGANNLLQAGFKLLKDHA